MVHYERYIFNGNYYRVTKRVCVRTGKPLEKKATMKDKQNSSAEHKGKHSQQNQDKISVMKSVSVDSNYKGAHQSAGYSTEGPSQGSVKTSSHSTRKRVLIVLGVIIALLAAIYGGGAWFFSTHFFPNTVLNDQDLSLQPSEVLANQIQNQADSYSLTIEGEGFSYTFKQGETAIDIDPQKIAEDTTKAQDIVMWPIEVFQTHDISDVVVASYDEEGLSEVLKEQVKAFNKEQTASKNATIVYDEDAEDFTLKPEVYGTQIDFDKLNTKVAECVKSMRTDCEVSQEDFIMPTVLAADPRTLAALQEAQEKFANNVTLTLNESVKAATIDKEDIASWLYIDDEDFSPKLEKDSVSAWIDETTEDMNTVGTKRTWTREDGKKCTVSGGTYGWKVDTSSLADTVYETLSKGGAKSIDIPCSQSGAAYNGAGKRDWGAYVDVDLSQQKARYYSADGELLHSCDIVSGRPTADRATPTGVYYLNSKQSPSTLTGYKPNGEIDYETPVEYWMPFVGNSVGLHDATWQSSFGGSRYKTNGSHGCVNLSLSDAKWFYNNLPTGTCIITHN